MRILKPALQTTVQDLGRPGMRHLGVGSCGAMDALSLRIGNDLVGNPAGAAGLELCLPPAALRFEGGGVIALTGADCAARLDASELRIGQAVSVGAGQTVSLGPALSGFRSYLCVAGGIDVPIVLGSRATDLQAAIGGLKGRLLRRDDILKIGPAAPRRPIPMPVLLPQWILSIRALPGPEFDDFEPASRDALFAASWAVTPQSNRMGYRLQGAALSNRRTGEMKSHAVFPGTIQVPPGGAPIVLMADGQATGGYPRIAAVIAADLPRLAQVAPGTAIRFVRTDRAEALRALQRQSNYLRRLHWSLHEN